jgi:hypothetical protein
MAMNAFDIRRRAADASEATRVAAAVIVFAGLPIGAAAALIPLRDHAPATTVALTLALIVALLAAAGTRLTAALGALSAGIGFDLFHTKPYGSLAISRASDLETTALLIGVGLVVGQLATRNRHHRARADEVSYDLGRIHGVAEMVAAGAPVDQVVLAVANELTDLLDLVSCRFDPALPDTPGPLVERFGSVTWGSLRWGFRTMGLPSREVSLVVQHQGRPLGRYVLLAAPGGRVSADQLLAAVALADQAGAAIASQGSPV